ncbi:S41 family peptidase [Nesterenkonia alkaliphila]|uniref:Tricorn protease homolog n=1 Tax=Nesterenkonia alkaliphila TaxID=1463631 RepID=A0A7K1UNR9_9MICC|nr:S41 family peptidase [Nesterenkonia alkaliphila]MVT27671.1 tricorn protease [Nesterenkonia alkaliphila]GFZ87983.1 tricorn protease [Nesterenkonia alkaliphila]
MSSAPYLRYPHLHEDLITFTAADDVWLAPAAGGRAWRLTRDAAPVRQPRITPDGAQVAFVSTKDGHSEVYAVSIDSGEVRRLTYWGNDRTHLLGFAPDGRLLVATNAGEAHRHQVIRALTLQGRWERLQLGSASGVAYSADGSIALTTPYIRPNAHWKRYRGGTAPKLWLDPKGKGSWEQLLPEDTAGIVDPMWIGSALLFVSDRAASFPKKAQEQANLWILEKPGAKKPKPPKQLTFQDEATGYVRDATTDGERITWHSRGEIWIKDSLQAAPRRLEVTLPGTAPAPLSLKPTENLEALVPDHTGDASLVSWRGKTFWLTHREGPARALAAESGVRTREPVLLGGTDKAAAASDAQGEDSLEIYTLDGSAAPQRVLTGELGRVLHLVSDPAGTRLAVVSHDGWIRLVSLTWTGRKATLEATVTEVTRSTEGEPQELSFSPDGRYLVWAHPTMWGQKTMYRIMLLDTAGTSGPVPVTSGRFHDFSPAFTADGKHLAFLSSRTFDPSYDDHSFDLFFTGTVRPWLIPLAASQPPPFGPSAEGWRLSEDKESKDNDDAAPASPDFTAEGAEERIVPFPVPSGAYTDLRAVKGGLVWIKEATESGELGSRRHGAPGEQPADQLIRWDFSQRKTSTVVEKLDDYAVSGDGSRLVVRHQDAVTVQPSAKQVEDDDPERVSVDLSRLRFTVDQAEEWRQMFSETHRLMGQQFWREDMDGVDWSAVGKTWRPVVDKVRSHDDLTDLLWEMVGELNTSHAYVIPQGASPGEERQLGLLGADLSAAEAGWRIDRILPGDSSDPEACSPLLAAGVDAQPGDLITAVDGQPVDPVFGPAKHLVGAAGKPVQLTLQRAGESRGVVVVPLASEAPLRYQDWVRSRREYVADKTAGRLGYLHVPDMQVAGWAQLHRDLHHAARGEGVLADMRYNGGGHTSQLVIAKLAQQVVAWNVVRHTKTAMPYPESAPRGPVVLLANEYSGSDGDIVNAVAQAIELGPVVGVRTWGGVVGIDGRFDLIDGTAVTQPKYSFWIHGKDWGVENYGVDPDIEVIHDPGQLFRAEDPQLDRAIEEALTRLQQSPAAAAPALPEPKVRH